MIKIKLFTDKTGLISMLHGTDFVALYEPSEGFNIEISVDKTQINQVHDDVEGVWVSV